MSKKRKGTDETDERDEETGELKKPEGRTVDEAPNNAEAVKNFILTRGGMLSAHDEEAIGAMLGHIGMDPEATADTPPAPEPQELPAPLEEGGGAPVGNGEDVAPPQGET
jgi:hypothetical protein